MTIPSGRDDRARNDGHAALERAIDHWVATWGPDGPIGPPGPTDDLPAELRRAFLERVHRLADDHRRFRALLQEVGLDEGERLTPASGKTGRYLLVGPIHEGGMGLVFLARDLEVDRLVAYKVRKDGLPAHLQRRFDREVAITDKVRQPGVVPIYGRVEDDSGRPAYVMEYVRGRTLAEVLAAPGPWDRVGALGHVLEASRIVAHAHALGVVHLDLSLKNVLIGDDGRTRVLDWGLAREAGWEDDPEAGPSRPGTLAFQGPSGSAGLPASPASDVHSLGVILDRVRLGVPSHRRDRPLGSIIAKARAARPEDRYPDARALAEDLARHLAGELVHAHRETAAERWGRLVRRHPAAAALASGLGLLAAIGLLIFAILLAHARQSDSLARRHAGEAEIARREAEAHAQTVLRVVRDRLGAGGPPGPQLSAIASRDLNNLLPFLRTLRASRPEDREVLANLAWVTGALGLWEYQNSFRERARALLTESADIAEALVAARPDDAEARRLALEALSGLLQVKDPRVDRADWPDRVLATCDEYERVLGPEATRQETEFLARWRIRVANDLFQRGRQGDAQTIAVAVRDQAKRALRPAPNDYDWLGHLDAATTLLKEREDHLAFLRETVARSPRSEQPRMALVLARGADLERTDDPEAARSAAIESLDVGGPVVAALERWVEPGPPAAWMSVFRFERSLAKSATLVERHEQAAAWKESTARLLHRFAGHYPELTPPNTWLVLLQLSGSHLPGRPGRGSVSLDEVEPLLHEVLAAFEGVDPDQAPTRSAQLAQAFTTIAFYRRMIGDDESARVFLERARAILETIGPEALHDPAPHLAWSEFWTQTAKAKLRAGEAVESILEDRRRAVEETATALDLDPNDRFIHGQHVDRLTRLARTQAEIGRYPDAMNTLSSIESLIHDLPEHPKMMRDILRRTAQAILQDGQGPIEERRHAAQRLLDRSDVAAPSN